MIRSFVLVVVLVACINAYDPGPGIGKNFNDHMNDAIESFNNKLTQDEKALLKELLKGDFYKEEMLTEIKNKSPVLSKKIEEVKNGLNGYFESKKVSSGLMVFLKPLYHSNVYTALSVEGGRNLTHEDYVKSGRDFTNGYEGLSDDARAELNRKFGFEEWARMMKKQAAL